MSMFNDIDWTRKGNDGICISEKSRNTRKDSRKDTGRSSVLQMKRSGMELFLKHLKENEILQCFESWNSEKEEWQRHFYTSTRMLRTQSSQRHCMERNRNHKTVYCDFQNRSRMCKKLRARTLVVSCAWIRKEMVRNSHVKAEWRVGSCRVDPVLWNEDLCEAKEAKTNCLFISALTTKQPKWFFAHLFPSISSVSTEQ